MYLFVNYLRLITNQMAQCGTTRRGGCNQLTDKERSVNKKSLCITAQAFIREDNRVRTGDLWNHNPAL